MKSLLATFAGSDGKTALLAVCSAGGVITFLGLAIAGFARGAPFDPGAYALGWGGVIAASAGAIGGHSLLAAKADAIPSAPEQGGA